MSDSDIRYYLALAWRRLPYLVLSALVGAGIGIGAALLIVPMYRATTRILIENPPIPAQLAPPTASSTAREQLQVVRERLTTRNSLLDMADRLGIYEGADPTPAPADMIEDLRQRIQFDHFVLNPDSSGASIVSISFDAQTPSLAAAVANSLASQLLEVSTDARAARAGETIRFFDTERARLGRALAKAETAILEFKNANQESLPDSLEFRRTQLAAAQEQLTQLTREEAMLYNRQINLGRIGNQLLQGGNAVAASPARQMLVELERALIQQRSIYVEDSDTIASLKTRISALREGLRADMVSASPSDPAVEMDRTEIQDRLDAIAEEKKQIAEHVDTLSASIAQTPASERALSALMRDRDNLQLQYNAVVAKLGDALIGQRIENGAGLETVSIIERATPPVYGLGTKRRLIAAGGLFTGGAVGAAIILLIEFLNRTIRRPSQVAATLQSPLLGTIPVLPKPRRRVLPGIPKLGAT